MFHNSETGKIGGALDIITFGIHDGTNSHLDALSHYRLNVDGQLLVFNGHPQDLDESGCKANAIDRTGTPIYVSDLEGMGEVRRRQNRER